MEELKIKVETQIRLDSFKPRSYQIPILDAIENKGYRKVLAILPRRAGKDMVSFQLCIRQCLRKVCVVFYIFPTFTQARRVIWDSITNDGKRILDYIPDELVQSKNSSELKIKFLNGSILQLVGSDNWDSLMGTNPQGVVFSEYALQDPRAYQFIRPILAANDGWAVFISCVSPNTLVIGEHGLQRIKNVSESRDMYSDLNKPIWGLNGFHNAEQFYYGGKQKTLIITLRSGYRIECTTIHPLWNGKEWVKAENISIGDLIPIQYGQNIWGNGIDVESFDYPNHGSIRIKPESIKKRSSEDPDFWYLLGLIHADGNYTDCNVTITKKKDQEIIKFLESEGFVTRLDGIHHELRSKTMCFFLEFIQFRHGARNKSFPEIFFTCTQWQMASFLQGVFDGDGCSHANRGTVKLTSTCEDFIRDVQVVLLNFGICSSVYKEIKLPTKKVNYESTIFNLEIQGYFAHVFYEKIGFRLLRKMSNRSKLSADTRTESANIYPVDVSKLEGYSLPSNRISNPMRMSRRMISQIHSERSHPYLEELLSEKFYFSPVATIEESESDVYDFVIPETNSFFCNGFIGHNTPRGKNHLWTLWNVATNSEDWFAYKMSVLDTGHISLEDIETDRKNGEMSEDLIQQEYFCSFDLGVEGAYYSKYLDSMRLKNQISMVPWESAFKVHTSWDLGVRDATSIIWFQTIGQTVRIIDCYENSKQGLEHYVKVIESKPYSYGKHFAPHDIRVQEWGTGLTRIEKAKQLGISFTIAPEVGLMDGIEAVRSSFSKIWIDEHNCKDLIKALENYRQEYDSKKKVYKSQPLHSWASHYADCMRYLCLSLPRTKDGMSAQELEERYRSTVYGNKMSGFFAD